MTESARAERKARVAVFASALFLYLISLSPGVFWGDSGEFAVRAATLELSPVARGYPLHRFLTWMTGCLTGSPALGANLVSALCGAVAVLLAHEAGKRFSGRRLGGFAAAAALGLCPTFWLYAGVAEVYTLHACFVLALLIAAHACADSDRAAGALGALLGLSLLHHRMIAFAAPGAVLLAILGLRRRGATRRGASAGAWGFVAGALPFAVLCLVASREPPPGTADPALWWFRDVFMGGDQNADHLLGSGVRSLAGNVAYVARWIVYDLPGPALLLAAVGLVALLRRRSDAGWAFLLLLPLHLVFPLRYDWTGDQFSFLVPFCAVAAVLVGVGAAAFAERVPRLAAATVAAVAAAPLLVAVALAWTPLGARVLPGLTDAARRRLVLPVHFGNREPEEFARRNLARLPKGARLHSDWGDGQVYRYLQDVDGLRTDVELRIWYAAGPRPAADAECDYLSEMPGTTAPPRAVTALRRRLEPLGEGLWRVLPEAR